MLPRFHASYYPDSGPAPDIVLTSIEFIVKHIIFRYSVFPAKASTLLVVVLVFEELFTQASIEVILAIMC